MDHQSICHLSPVNSSETFSLISLFSSSLAVDFPALYLQRTVMQHMSQPPFLSVPQCVQEFSFVSTVLAPCLSLYVPPKDFTVRTGNHLASGPTQQHEQCSHPPPPCPEPNGANESHRRVSKPDRKTAVPNYSVFGIYWNPSLTHHPRNSLSNAPPNLET